MEIVFIYVYIPPLVVQRSLLHPSQAPPSLAYTMGSKGRPWCALSRLVAALEASLTVSVKIRLNALWCISGLVGMLVRLVLLGYNVVWSCRFFRSQKSCRLLSVCLAGPRRIVWLLIFTHRYSSLLIVTHHCSSLSSLLIATHRYSSLFIVTVDCLVVTQRIEIISHCGSRYL